jgi:hypothetical protein
MIVNNNLKEKRKKLWIGGRPNLEMHEFEKWKERKLHKSIHEFEITLV